MKKIISSAIAIAMLSSTVAMAAPVVAPTPQNETTTYTQDFDNESTKETGNTNYGSGPNRVYKNFWSDNFDAIVANPYAEAGATTNDKVLKIGRTQASNNKLGSYVMYPNAELSEGDKFTISFDMAVTNKKTNDNLSLRITINDSASDKEVFKLFNTGWFNPQLTTDTTNNELGWPAVGGGFKHYELVFDTGARTVTYNCDSDSQTRSLKDSVSISKINNFDLRPELGVGDGAKDTSAFYLDNMSYSVTHVTNETVETFDSCNMNGWQNKKAGTFKYAKYALTGNAYGTQEIDSAKGKVLKTKDFDGGADNYVAMPFTATLTGDDVLTYKFDFAVNIANGSTNGTPLEFYLYDKSGTAKNMNFKLTNADSTEGTAFSDDLAEVNVTNGRLFIIQEGRIRLGGRWQTEGSQFLKENDTFHTITVVIDNSDDAHGKKATLTIYVDGAKYGKTCYIEDNDGAVDSFRNITGFTLDWKTTGTVATRYFDNFWATVTENKITVNDDKTTASYTYPVVYDTDTNAIFVKAYYDTNNRLISADTADAKPSSSSRTVTTTLNEPEGTVKTKVFRWDSLDSIHQLSPAYDSSKVN